MEYFAFGETFVEEHSNTNRTPYLFNGKELDEETGLYYYGARYYDAVSSVWLAIDLMAEKYPNISPYAYGFNNPLRFIDPTGMEGEGVTDPPTKEQQAQMDESVKKYGYLSEKYAIRSLKVVGSAQGSHIAKGENIWRAYGYKAEGEVSGEYGKINGGISGFSVGYEGTTEPGGVHGSASVYGVSTEGGVRLGTEDYNIAVEGKGSALKAEVTGDAGLYTGKSGKYGGELGAEAGAYGLEGEYSPSFSIFGVKFGVTIGGSVGSAHIGGRTAVMYDNTSKTGELTLEGHLGLGVGYKYGFTISNTDREINKKKKK